MKWKTFVLTLGTLSVLLLSIGTADAHVRKATWLLQGTAAFSSSSGDLYGNESLTTISLSPTVHYFIINKLAVGGKLDVVSRSQGNNSNSSLFIGPSVRYFFARDMDATVNPYLGGAILLRSMSSETTVGNTTFKSDASGSSIQIAAGLAWFLKEHLALTPELSINLESLEGNSGTTIMLGVGLAGFLYTPTNHSH